MKPVAIAVGGFRLAPDSQAVKAGTPIIDLPKPNFQISIEAAAIVK